MNSLLARSSIFTALGLALALAGCDPLTPPSSEPDASSDPVVNGDVCGGLLGKGCKPGSYCDFPLDALCGAADQTGTCKPSPDACTEQYAPVCGCDDRTYGNACAANANGVSVARNGACDATPTPADASPPRPKPDAGSSSDAGSTSDAGVGARVCGGFAGLRCASGEFCDYGATCSSIADGSGVCRAQPGACDLVYLPVCGCDGKTYGNECVAHGKGVSVAATGACAAPPADAGTGKRCGGWAGPTCAKTEFCDFGALCSDITDASGVCAPLTGACQEIYAPVCGCDGKTYSNECDAHSKGVSVASLGECKKPDPGTGHTCGGIAGLSCAANQFCNYEPPAGQGCDGTIADAAGVCQTTPQACTLQYDPVCGCDGNTYGNACGAHSAGVSVAGRGECAPKQVSCDRRSLLCKRAEPVCPTGQVVSIEGSCFGPCVNIEQCSCKEAAACPAPETYTCHLSRGVCGPFVR